MIRRLKEPFGKAGLTVAVVALIFAMVGGAYAAGALTGKQKKEVEKIAKKFQGTGPAGAAGANGTNGKDGTNGSNGAGGKDGVGVTTAAATSGPSGECPTVGGVKITSASGTTTVCNGDEGPPGPTETSLPAGKTSTGLWSFSGAGAGGYFTTINFPLRLSQDSFPTFVQPNETTAQCPGDDENPTAVTTTLDGPALCVYIASLSGNVSNPSSPTTGSTVDGTSGLTFEFTSTDPSQEAWGYGSWAVTEGE